MFLMFNYKLGDFAHALIPPNKQSPSRKEKDVINAFRHLPGLLLFAFTASMLHSRAGGRLDSCVSSKSSVVMASANKRRNAVKSCNANRASSPSSGHRYSDIADPPSSVSTNQIYEDVDQRNSASSQDPSLRRHANPGVRVVADVSNAAGSPTLPAGGMVYLQLPELQHQQPEGTRMLHPVFVHLPDAGGVMLLGGGSTHESGQRPYTDGDDPPSCYQTMDLKGIQLSCAMTPGCYASLTSKTGNPVGCDVIGFRADDGKVVVGPAAVYCRSEVYDDFSSVAKSREQPRQPSNS